MDDPLIVRGFKCLGNLSRDRQRFVDEDRALRDPIRQRRAVDEFEHERGDRRV